MKKITKTLTASLLAAAATANIFAVPASHVAYADSASTEVVKGDVISVKSIPSTGRVGYPVIIPKMEAKAIDGNATTISSITNIQPIVTRPDGRSVTIVECDVNANGEYVEPGDATATGKAWMFSPDVSGTYKLVYKGTNEDSVETLSEVFSIKVTRETFDMTIDPNSSIIIPSTVDTNKDRFTGGVVKEIKLPHPTVKDKNDFVIYENGAINPVFAEYDALKANNAKTPEQEERYEEILADFADHNITDDEIALYKNSTLKVTVETETKSLDSTADAGSTNLLQKDGDGFYFFRPEQGTNVIHYVLMSNKGTALHSLTRTVLGSDTYDHTAIKLGFSAADRPTTASLNDKVRLPLAKGYNKSDANSAVNVETIIEVKLVEGKTKTPVEVQSDADGLYFIPDVKDGDYEITYNVKDYYGNTATAYSYRIENVVDGKAPTMYIVKAFDYTTTADAIIAMQNAEYMIPTKVGRAKGEIIFPAMFGVDSVVAYENLTFYRTITSTNLDQSINLLDSKYLKAIGTEDVTTITSNAQKAAHEAVINLNEIDEGKKVFPAGDYTVTYTIRDGSGYSASRSFNFTIEETFEDTTAPVITFGDNFPTLVQKGQEVTIAKPTITDTVDGNLEVNYYVSVGGVDVEIFANEDGNLSFNMNQLVGMADATIYDYALSNGDNKISIKAVAVDDYNQTTTESLSITVRNADDNQQIAVADSVAGDFVNGLPTITNTYKQGSVVTVAGATFTDNDANLSIIVTVRDADGNKVTGVRAIGAIEKKTVGQNTVYAHPGVKFTATKAQKYTVTYTAIDAGNNVVAYTVQLPTMTDSEKPVIVGVTSGKVYEIELGQKLDLGRVTVVDNVDNGLVPTISCDDHPEYVNGTIFAPTEVGTYTVKYTAQDNAAEPNAADPVLVEVIVKDTTKPTLTINNKDFYPTTMKEQTSVTNNADFVAIELPSFSAEDETYDFISDAAALNMSVNAKIEISGPDGKTYTVDNTNSKYKITYDATKDVYKFVPTTKGSYEVKYTAVDASGNEAESYTITVMVGDTVPPKVDYTGELNANLKVGDVVKIYEDKITVTDYGVAVAEGEELTFTSITVEDASGNTVDYKKLGDNEDIRAYTFDKAGTYTLTIVGRDEAGNPNTFVYKFNVTSDASTSSFKDNATGVVLIVVSLLILAGVIVYFALSKKKTSPKKTVKKVEKKEVKAEENKD